MEQIKVKGLTCIFYENKNRILKTLRSIEEIFGMKQLVYIGVEMTKMFERNLKGKASDLYDAINDNPDFT